jgi:hypothetical protein
MHMHINPTNAAKSTCVKPTSITATAKLLLVTATSSNQGYQAMSPLYQGASTLYIQLQCMQSQPSSQNVTPADIITSQLQHNTPCSPLCDLQPFTCRLQRTQGPQPSAYHLVTKYLPFITNSSVAQHNCTNCCWYSCTQQPLSFNCKQSLLRKSTTAALCPILSYRAGQQKLSSSAPDRT